MSGRRAGLFQKYFAFIVLLVSAGLVASGAIGLYFSYQETRNSLVSLQREKALTAAVRIEQFLRDIESQLGWTTLPLLVGTQDPMEARRLDFLKVLRQVPAVTDISHLDDPFATRRREVTIMFVDMRGFTAFSETASPEDVLGVPRDCHGEIGRLVSRYEGTVEHFAGDAPVPACSVPSLKQAVAYPNEQETT